MGASLASGTSSSPTSLKPCFSPVAPMMGVLGQRGDGASSLFHLGSPHGHLSGPPLLSCGMPWLAARWTSLLLLALPSVTRVAGGLWNQDGAERQEGKQSRGQG